MNFPGGTLSYYLKDDRPLIGVQFFNSLEWKIDIIQGNQGPAFYVADPTMKIVAYLPNPLLIIGALKTEDMIRISSRGFCGEDDFGYRRE
jgi:hypothetical protein